MKKKVIFCTMLVMSLMMTGCKNVNTQETEMIESVVEGENSKKAGNEEIIGMIQDISNTEMTLSVRDNSQREPKSLDEMKPGQKNVGGEPDHEEEDEEASKRIIALTDNTEFFAASGESTLLTELKEGNMVIVETDDSNVAIKITVQSAQGVIDPEGKDRSGGMGTPGGKGGPEGMGGPGNGHSAPESYVSVTEYTADADISGETYASTGSDENAVHVMNGANVILKDFTLTRNSSDSTGRDSSSFYGIGAGILVSDGTLSLSGGVINTDSDGGAGVFSYGNGVAYVSDTVIRTIQDTSGGIHVAGGGTLHAENLTIETQGESSAAIRSDRGGGVMTVQGGSYLSCGTGSPAVYCTADISIADADLEATGAEAVCIEGLNSLKLTNCNLTGNIPENSQNDCDWTVILYQSMSGDSEIGNSTFEMIGGTLTSHNGGLFYTTNTESTFYLNQVEITETDSDFFLKATGNANKRGWGQSGANGAACTFTADNQSMSGNVIWDSISTLNLYATNNSSLTGAVLQDESCAGNGGNGYANLLIDETSVWTVTGDSILTSLQCEGTITGADGKQVTIIGTDGTVYVDGDSSYKITVEVYSNSLA